MSAYHSLISASRALIEAATGKEWRITETFGGTVQVSSYVDGQATGLVASFDAGNYACSREQGKANAALACHAQAKLPLALQGLEDALQCVEVLREFSKSACRNEGGSAARECHAIHNLRETEWCAVCQARAALAHFDAREKETTHGV